MIVNLGFKLPINLLWRHSFGHLHLDINIDKINKQQRMYHWLLWAEEGDIGQCKYNSGKIGKKYVCETYQELELMAYKYVFNISGLIPNWAKTESLGNHWEFEDDVWSLDIGIEKVSYALQGSIYEAWYKEALGSSLNIDIDWITVDYHDESLLREAVETYLYEILLLVPHWVKKL